MERSTAEAGGTGIQVIARAAGILRALRLAPAGLSQAEVAEQVGLARSTVHRRSALPHGRSASPARQSAVRASNGPAGSGQR